MGAGMTLGLMLALAGSLFIYLASPNQRWLAAPWAALPARGAGGLLLLGAWLALLRDFQVLVAVFFLGTWLMLLFVAWPYLGALMPGRGGR